MDFIDFDSKITLGVVVHLVVVVGAMFKLYYGLAARIDQHERQHERMEQKVDMIWQWFKVEHRINGARDKT